MLHIVGNGPSRLKYNLNDLEEWWGCNAIFDTHTPDIAFSVDIDIHEEVISNGYYTKHKIAVGDWSGIELAMWSLLLEGYKTSGEECKVKEVLKLGDTHFIVQGTYDECLFLGYNEKYKDNIITFDYPELRNMFTGMTALGYAMMTGRKEITLLGFDALQTGDVDNVFTGRVNYPDKYTKEFRVLEAQRAQFIALLERFDDVKVYFKNDLDKLELVEYDKLSYYEQSEKWILGEGDLSNVMRYIRDIL